MHPHLEKMIATKKVPNALLFVGENLGGSAVKFALSLCSKRDLHEYHPHGKLSLHTVESIKMLCKESAVYPLESACKFFIIHCAEKMLPASSNALLKTVEEPLSHSCIIFLTNQPDKMLLTLRSRAQTLFFPKEKMAPSLRQEQFLALLQRKTSFKEMEAFALEIENERKAMEKQLTHDIPKEWTVHQKEWAEEEIAAECALKYSQTCQELLETLYKRNFSRLRLCEVEKIVNKGKLALERTIPLTCVLPALCIELQLI